MNTVIIKKSVRHGIVISMNHAGQTRKSKKIRACLKIAFSFCMVTTACGGHESAKDPSKSPDHAVANEAKDRQLGHVSGIHEGDKAPIFSIDSVNDQGRVVVAPGKVTLVDFWATWCQPCKKNFPKYQRLYTKYKASGLAFVAVSVDDDKSGIAEFAASYGATFPIGWDEDHKITDLYQLSGVPALFILGKDGTVKYIHFGDNAGDEIQIEKEITAALTCIDSENCGSRFGEAAVFGLMKRVVCASRLDIQISATELRCKSLL